MSTKFLSPGWRMPRNANQSKSSNYSLDFNSSPYIDTNLNTGSYSSFSVSAWIKADTLSSGKVVAAQTRNGNWSLSSWLLYIEAPSSVPYMTFYMMSGDLPILAGKNTVLSINQWYHIVATWDGATSKMYIDGVKETIEGTVSSMNTSVVNTLIGASHNSTGTGATGGWDGLINEVSIFNYALSQSQVTTLWGGGTSVSNPMALPSPPIAYYPLGTSAYNGQYLAENNAIGDYVFDNSSSNNRILISNNSIPVSGDSSISFWFNAGTNSGYKSFIASQNYYTTGINNTFSFQINGTTVRFIFANGQTLATILSTTIDLNTWYNLTVTLNISTDVYKVYINGTQVGSDTSLGGRNISDLNQGFSIFNGLASGGSTYNSGFIGKLSNVQIWNKELIGSEIETLYNYGSPIRTLANIPQNSNLKAWYKLDASEVYNNSTTKWSIDNNQNPSAYSSSLDFDAASGDYIDCGNDSTLNLTSEITCSAWVKFEGTTETYYTVMSNFEAPQKFVLYYYRAGAAGSRMLRLRINSSNGTLSGFYSTYVDLSDDKWHHLAFTFDGTTNTNSISVYVDNIKTSFTATNSGIKSNTTSTLIGHYLPSSSNWGMVGKISNASIWNTALTSAQVTELYNNGTPSNLSNHSGTSNLVSWWKLNNTTTGIEDSKGSNNGTNSGATEYPGFVNTLAGESSGMSQANLVQSDLQTVAPYSKYAMNFDGTDGITISVGSLTLPSYSMSIWINVDSLPSSDWRRIFEFGNRRFFGLQSDGKLSLGYPSPGWVETETVATISTNKWHHLVFADNGTNTVVYINGVGETASNTTNATGSTWWIANVNSGTGLDAKLSNCSVWNTALTSSQVTELYNEGLPSNLNSHSAYSNLVSWWQLGENSSYVSGWTFADEKGTNNGTGNGLAETDLTNGVGTTANGVSSGMSEGNLVGDAPYSTANAISSNMAVTSRVTGSGNTP